MAPWPDKTDSTDDTDEALAIGGPAGEVLGLCDEFFRSHASPAVHAELRRFLTDLGHHPVAGLGAFLATLSPRPCTPTGPTRSGGPLN